MYVQKGEYSSRQAYHLHSLWGIFMGELNGGDWVEYATGSGDIKTSHVQTVGRFLAVIQTFFPYFFFNIFFEEEKDTDY